VPLGKLGRKIIKKRFPQYQATQAETFRGNQLSSHMGRERLRQARPTVPLGKLGCKIKTNGFWLA
jgi:hypothetical protein